MLPCCDLALVRTCKPDLVVNEENMPEQIDADPEKIPPSCVQQWDLFSVSYGKGKRLFQWVVSGWCNETSASPQKTGANTASSSATSGSARTQLNFTHTSPAGQPKNDIQKPSPSTFTGTPRPSGKLRHPAPLPGPANPQTRACGSRYHPHARHGPGL